MPTSAERIGGQDADMTATPPGSAEPFRLGYQPALDGLRAVSVLAVMLHHSGLLVGGWLGVDVFFALSGFLITTLLIEEHRRTGVIGLKRFYVRRALRLLPGLLALVIVLGTITIATSASVGLAAILLRLAAVLFYVANWAIMAGFGLYPFAHTWSLAIEEQFYALWPLALLALLRYVRTRVVIVSIVGAGIAASIIWRGVLLHGGSLPWAYQGVDARADSLLIGCAVAMLVSWRMVPDSHAALITRRWAGLAAAMGLCLLFATARFPSAFRDHFASTLTALAGGLLIGKRHGFHPVWLDSRGWSPSWCASCPSGSSSNLPSASSPASAAPQGSGGRSPGSCPRASPHRSGRSVGRRGSGSPRRAGS